MCWCVKEHHEYDMRRLSDDIPASPLLTNVLNFQSIKIVQSDTLGVWTASIRHNWRCLAEVNVRQSRSWRREGSSEGGRRGEDWLGGWAGGRREWQSFIYFYQLSTRVMAHIVIATDQIWNVNKNFPARHDQTWWDMWTPCSPIDPLVVDCSQPLLN